MNSCLAPRRSAFCAATLGFAVQLCSVLCLSGCSEQAPGNPPVCGDGVLDPDETCDEGPDNNDMVPGACRTDCQPARCGDGVSDPDEACDVGDLGGSTCVDLGFDSGSLSCLPGCDYDLRGCVGGCGNGVRESDEICDGTELSDMTCEALGHLGGVMACGPDCQYDELGCFDCGDGQCHALQGETIAVCAEDCGWTEITTGSRFTCGLRQDGTVWCWGANDKGQLGNGTHDDSSTPTPVLDLADVTDISAGTEHACALSSDGTVWCWGYKASGRLGTGEMDASTTPTPVQVLDLDGVVSVASMYAHTCALRSDGTVWCWGRNRYRQTGNFTDESQLVPVQVPGPAGIQAIAVGFQHTCALAQDGSIWCWGDNRLGQLGRGYYYYSESPALVEILQVLRRAPNGSVIAFPLQVPCQRV